MTAASTATAATLTGIAMFHAAWGAGSTFPYADRATLADRVAGSTAAPKPRDCFAVAGLLLIAAGVVGGVLPIGARTRRLGSVGIAAILGGRGALGMAGRTGSIVPWTPSERFTELDRGFYGPLCLALAGGALSSTLD